MPTSFLAMSSAEGCLHKSLSLPFLKTYCLFMCEGHTPWHLCGGEETALESAFAVDLVGPESPLVLRQHCMLQASWLSASNSRWFSSASLLSLGWLGLQTHATTPSLGFFFFFFSSMTETRQSCLHSWALYARSCLPSTPFPKDFWVQFGGGNVEGTTSYNLGITAKMTLDKNPLISLVLPTVFSFINTSLF